MSDSDTSNGNGHYVATELIRKYDKCYDNFVKAGENRGIFKTKISSALKDGVFMSSPRRKEDKEVTLESAFGTNLSSQNVLKAFFNNDERSKSVDNGFYGRSVVGAIFTYYDLDQDDNGTIGRVLNNIVNDLKQPENEVRLFIAGSAFGGTGASGVLPIVRTLVEKAKKDDDNNRKNLYICAALMLPYFEWNDPTYPEGISEDQKKETDNLSNRLKKEVDDRTKQVVTDYRDLMHGTESDKLFSRLYVLGAPDKAIRGNFAGGGSGQNNWPHIVELFAAAEAGKFFAAETAEIEGYNLRKGNPYKVKGEDMSKLIWNDYDDGERLSNKINALHIVNSIFSSIIADTVFDHTVRAGVERPFKTKDNSVFKNGKGGKKLRNEVWIDYKQGTLAKLFPWFFKGHRHFASGGIFGSTWSWTYQDLDEHFNDLFEYFTQTSKWYNKLIRDFNDPETVILPNLFEDSRIVAMHKRANLSEFSQLFTNKNLQNEFIINATRNGQDKIYPPEHKIKNPNGSSGFLAEYVCELYKNAEAVLKN